jgi:hypothetical protein
VEQRNKKYIDDKKKRSQGFILDRLKTSNQRERKQSKHLSQLEIWALLDKTDAGFLRIHLQVSKRITVIEGGIMTVLMFTNDGQIYKRHLSIVIKNQELDHLVGT